jgi:hypothetical protein
MTRQSQHDLFPIHGREFATPEGPVTATVRNDPDAAPSSGQISDQVWFMLKFSNGKELTLVLSNIELHHDPKGLYRARAFHIVEDWLTHGGPARIDFFGA